MNAEHFAYEMMDTPSLARECQRVKEEIDQVAHDISLGRGDVALKRNLQAKLKLAKRILKARQLTLF